MRALVAGMLLFLATPGEPGEADRFESLRYNPRERTASGISALGQGDIAAGLERLEAASRLDPANPLTAYNAGTARLVAGHEGAATRLEEAAAVAPEELQPAIQYNLGNARLGEQDPKAAIEAFKNTLRLDPGNMQAKFNLEVAQKLLEQQQQEQEQEQEQDQQEQGASDQQNQEQDPEEQQEGEQSQQTPDPQPQDQQGSDPENDRQERQSPLPDFQNQQDMTAEQAAAILDAVENLEREQRRQQAAERARRKARTGKDW